MNKVTAIFAALAILAGCTATTGPVTDLHTLTSPSGTLEMTFQLTADGTPQYTLSYDDQKVILAKVDKAGGRAWLDKTLQSGYVPAKRQRQEQTVENTSKISADLAEKKARRAARAKKTE